MKPSKILLMQKSLLTPSFFGPRLALWLNNADASTITNNCFSPAGNLVSAPEDANAWTSISGVFTNDLTIAPDNTLTANRFVPTSANAYFAPTVTQPANVQYTFSVYLKSNGLTSALIAAGGAGNNYGYDVNIATGQVNRILGNAVQRQTTSLVVVNCGNGWFNFALTATPINNVLFLVSPSGGINGTNALFAWGAQLRQGSCYFPWKWRVITKLPNNHPFKSRPPYI